MSFCKFCLDVSTSSLSASSLSAADDGAVADCGIDGIDDTDGADVATDGGDTSPLSCGDSW